jgi:predicted glycosyl hydrolase (DUF1957 family)
MKYLNLFFHIYQPPVQSDSVLSQIVLESYRPLVEKFITYKNLKFSLNINYSLVELLLRNGYMDVIGNIRKAYENGNLELTTTGAYHPIFPLIPEKEVERQLEANERGIRSNLVPTFHPEGVFPPEMAFSGQLVSIFKRRGYKWTLVDDGNIKHLFSYIPYNSICTFDDFSVFLRSNFWTNKFAKNEFRSNQGREVVDELREGLDQWMGDKDGYLIIALDGETFGHHHPELGEVFLNELFDALSSIDDIKLAHLSDLYKIFPKVPSFIPPGSWSTDDENIMERDYFSWWNGSRNEIHRFQWEFTNFVLKEVRRLADRELNFEMDKALYSCQYWWASFWKFNPDEIYKGVFNQMQILQKVADLNNDHYDGIKRGEEIFRHLVVEIEKERHFREI